MCRTAHRKGSQPRKGTGELRVMSDLTPDTPICEAELAAIKGFLWQELRAILDDSVPVQKESPAGGAKAAALCHNGDAAYPRSRRKTA